MMAAAIDFEHEFFEEEQGHFFEEDCDEEPIQIIYENRVHRWLEETKGYRDEFITNRQHAHPLPLLLKDFEKSQSTGCFSCFPILKIRRR